jgi:hypothetical protein
VWQNGGKNAGKIKIILTLGCLVAEQTLTLLLSSLKQSLYCSLTSQVELPSIADGQRRINPLMHPW